MLLYIANSSKYVIRIRVWIKSIINMQMLFCVKIFKAYTIHAKVWLRANERPNTQRFIWAIDIMLAHSGCNESDISDKTCDVNYFRQVQSQVLSECGCFRLIIITILFAAMLFLASIVFVNNNKNNVSYPIQKLLFTFAVLL